MAGLVTNTEVETLALLNPDFDQNLITDYYILHAQNKHLKYILTEDLFHSVVITPANYTSLISGADYTYESKQRRYEGLKKCLSYYVMFECLPFIYSQVGAAGIFKNRRETADPVTLEEMQNLRGQFFTNAQVESELIIKYIEENISSYPLYEGNIEDYMLEQNVSNKKRLYGGMIF